MKSPKRFERFDSPYFVYLVKSKGDRYFKIGIASNVHQRIASLGNILPFYLEILETVQLPNYGAAYTVEHEMHALYKDSKVKGEWFTNLTHKKFKTDIKSVIEKNQHRWLQ